MQNRCHCGKFLGQRESVCNYCGARLQQGSDGQHFCPKKGTALAMLRPRTHDIWNPWRT